MIVRPNKTRIVGIDFGLARLGVALSDESKTIASPLKTIKTERRTEDTVEKLLDELVKHGQENHYTIEAIVIGLPLMMSGKKGHLADEVTHFVEFLKKQASFPIITWDERLTTVQAERSLLESSLSRKRRSTVVDTVAAALILQSYLDCQKLKPNC